MTDPDVIPYHRHQRPSACHIGDLARCHDCGTWARLTNMTGRSTITRTWQPVRWWHLRDRATIRRHTRQTRKGDA